MSAAEFITVRHMRPRDLAGVAELAARVPTAPHWPMVEFKRLLHVGCEQPHRRGAWVAVREARHVLGFGIASHVEGTAELEAVVTAPEYRRQGVATALVHGVVGWCEAIGAEQLVLEVRASNVDALRLYARLGFRHDGVRRDYYQQPQEDALLMSLLLGTPLAS